MARVRRKPWPVSEDWRGWIWYPLQWRRKICWSQLESGMLTHRVICGDGTVMQLSKEREFNSPSQMQFLLFSWP